MESALQAGLPFFEFQVMPMARNPAKKAYSSSIILRMRSSTCGGMA